MARSLEGEPNAAARRTKVPEQGSIFNPDLRADRDRHTGVIRQERAQHPDVAAERAARKWVLPESG
jgi:hypothetical protein